MGIYSSTWRKHLARVIAVLQSLRVAQLTANLGKCTFAKTETQYLGFLMGNGRVKPKNPLSFWRIKCSVNYSCRTKYNTKYRFHDIYMILLTPSNSLNKLLCLGMNWDQWVGICSDRAQAMMGKHSGLVTRVQQVASRAKWTHCIKNREALAAKKMPQTLTSVIQHSMQVINFLKAWPLNARLFSVLCQEMGSDHHQLLFHTEERWSSRGRALRLFELCEEAKIFLIDAMSDLVNHLLDCSWLAMLAYLVDIFDHLNSLNASIQDKDSNILLLTDKVAAFPHSETWWSPAGTAMAKSFASVTFLGEIEN
ncbi:ZMYM6 protein, partial [Polyodon spathula]|nr:ZMYM6 protein [Polyodon spathula]